MILEREQNFEQSPMPATEFDFELDLEGFDINAAFQDAVHGVATDEELELDEKVRRMEVIVSEATSETFRSFVDFRQKAAQIEMYCNNDHALNESLQNSEIVSGFMDSHKNHDDHDHNNLSSGKNKNEDDEEIDPKTGKKKKKKKRGWFN